MMLKQGVYIQALLVFSFFSLCFAETDKDDFIQFYIKAPEAASCSQGAEVTVYALNQQGLIARDYIGKRGVSFKVKEEGGSTTGSYLPLPEALEFKEGKAQFTLADSEAEILEITVKENNHASPFPAAIIFQAAEVTDPAAKLKATETEIILDTQDSSPPEILEIKMETLAFVEIIFSEELDDISAGDPYNYEVVCLSTQRPRNIELHKDKVILELDELLKPYEQMYVAVKNIKDLAGNAIASGTRSPAYAVPKLPIRLELEVPTTTPAVNTAVNVRITARCISGRTPQFINDRFTISVSETISDNSFTLSPQSVQMTKGRGEFSISDSAVERLTITVRDPDGIADPGTIELNFI